MKDKLKKLKNLVEMGKSIPEVRRIARELLSELRDKEIKTYYEVFEDGSFYVVYKIEKKVIEKIIKAMVLYRKSVELKTDTYMFTIDQIPEPMKSQIVMQVANLLGQEGSKCGIIIYDVKISGFVVDLEKEQIEVYGTCKYR